MKVLTLLLRQSPGLFLFTIVTGAASGASSAALLALVNVAIHGSPRWSAAALAGGFVALCVIVPLTRTLSAYLMVRLGQAAVHDLRVRLSRALLATPLATLETMGPHRLLVLLTDDLNAVADSLINVPALFINGFVVAGCVAYLAWLSPRMFLLFLCALVVGSISYQLLILRGAQRVRSARAEEDTLYGYFQGLTHGNKELKLHGRRSESFFSGLSQSSGRLRSFNVGSSLIAAAASSWGQSLFFVVVGVLLFLHPRFGPGGRAELVGYILTLLFMMTPVQIMLNSTPALQRAGVAVKRIEEVAASIFAFGQPRVGGAGVGEPSSWRAIELRRVTHRYQAEGENGGFRLGPLDLTFRRGELVFIIGGNGSGKTTLLKLLAGLYEPESGQVLVDGSRLDEPGRELHRQRFSVVFADFYLFQSLHGLEAEDLDDRAGGLLRQLGLHGQVQVRDGTLSTIQLSQGQRKRLALLIAYLEDRDIYVFDEWAADQDPSFKETFYHRLLPELKARGKTVFVISHDDRYFGVAERIVKLDSGQLVRDEYAASPQLANA